MAPKGPFQLGRNLQTAVVPPLLFLQSLALVHLFRLIGTSGLADFLLPLAVDRCWRVQPATKMLAEIAGRLMTLRRRLELICLFLLLLLIPREVQSNWLYVRTTNNTTTSNVSCEGIGTLGLPYSCRNVVISEEFILKPK